MTAANAVVYVVDDDQSVRQSVARLLGSMGFVVQVFASAQAFLDSCGSEARGCLILDVELPGLSGLDLQRKISGMNIPLPIVFLTGHGDIPMTVKAMKLGAVDFLTKPCRTEQLKEAVTNAIAKSEAAHAEKAEQSELRRRYESLTPRERDVMAGVVAGLLTKQIAFEFGTKVDTVKEQRAQVMQKMQAASVAELVRIAGRLGLSRAPATTPPNASPKPER